jgi:lysophospholipase L1-like esterase
LAKARTFWITAVVVSLASLFSASQDKAKPAATAGKKSASKKTATKKAAAHKAGASKSASSKPAKKPTSRRTTSKTVARRHVPKGPPPKPMPPPEPLHVEIESKDEALGTFYSALASKSGVVRILHFGDSHVAADIWTRYLRDAFQNRFGDAGSGSVLPGSVFRGYRRVGVQVRAPAKNWHGLTLRQPPGDGLLGLAGAALRGDTHSPAASATARFSSFELQVAAPPGQTPCAEVSVEDELLNEEPVELDREQGEARPYGSLLLVHNRTPLPLGFHTLKVAPCGDGSWPIILGLDLKTGQPGVIYDSFGINGVQFVDLDKIQQTLRHDLMARLNPTLIIVSYGTNDMGRRDFDRVSYQAECVRMLRAIREDAGGVPVLVTGPIDRPGRTPKVRDHFHERSDMAVAALEAAAKETGCAFWDARAAMGGFGAMLRWRKSSLAQTDLVHLTEPGYKMLANMLLGELLPPETPAAVP